MLDIKNKTKIVLVAFRLNCTYIYILQSLTIGIMKIWKDDKQFQACTTVEKSTVCIIIEILARAHLLYEKSKRPAFSVLKQISDVTSRLLLDGWTYYANNNKYLFTKKLIKTNLCLDSLNIRSAKYLFWF